jgi:hypothetical protein
MGWERQHRSPTWARLRKVLRQTKIKKTKAPRLPGSKGQVRLLITLASMPVLLSTEEQCETWLNGTTGDGYAFTRSHPLS